MNTYKRHRFPPDIISYAVWLYFRFNLSHRDIEDLLAQRGITVSRESVRLWCIKFGAIYIKIKGEWRYLYHAVDKQGKTIDFLLTAKRDTKAARRFLNKAIEPYGKPSLINIDKNGANTAGIKQYNHDEKSV